MTRFLVYGGTFDPPHVGHVQVPHAAMLHLGFNQVIYVLARLSPLKIDAPPTQHEHRLAMLQLALRDAPWATISEIEIDRCGTSYTIDTLEILQSTMGDGDAMRLLIGADQWEQFDAWHRWQEIITIANPVVMPREGYTLNDERTLPINALPAESTIIRDLVAHDEPIDQLVDPNVAAYITKHSLYR